MRKKNKKEDRIRDLLPGEVWKDRVEYLSLEQYNNKVQLAEYYMRKAGISPRRKAIVLTEDDSFLSKLKWLFGGVFLATIYLLATNTFGK